MLTFYEIYNLMSLLMNPYIESGMNEVKLKSIIKSNYKSLINNKNIFKP
jgi:hypothetical protein